MKSINTLITFIVIIFNFVFVDPVKAQPPSRKDERALNLLEKHVKVLDRLVPTLTPDELKWIHDEWSHLEANQNKNTTPRISKFINSEEYAISSIRKHIEECEKLIDVIKSSKNNQDILLSWLILVDRLYRSTNLEGDFSKLLLKNELFRENLSKEKSPELGVIALGGSREGDVQIIWSFWASHIMDEFLLADLKNNICPTKK